MPVTFAKKEIKTKFLTDNLENPKIPAANSSGSGEAKITTPTKDKNTEANF